MKHDAKWWVVRIVLTVVVGAILLELPQYYPDFRVAQFNTVLCYAIAALGLNLLAGFNGQISVGHGAFFGIGAYTSVILVVDHGWPHFATIVVAAVLAFVVGLIVGPSRLAHPGPVPGARHARAGDALPTRRHPIQRSDRWLAGQERAREGALPSTGLGPACRTISGAITSSSPLPSSRSCSFAI